jgi:hypothetical protein
MGGYAPCHCPTITGGQGYLAIAPLSSAPASVVVPLTSAAAPPTSAAVVMWVVVVMSPALFRQPLCRRPSPDLQHAVVRDHPT